MAVSSKKDKLIEDAQKFAMRGQFDKAVKIYEQIVAAEPAAINHRQKLAELLVKCGRNEDARKELETIGKYFSKNGFYLKAIAVYKQLQKNFPADISISLTLAELNEKHGLVANSLSEYKLVYEFHEKAGNHPEALKILDRMQQVDPQNIAIKIRLAEACVQQGMKKEAYDVLLKTAPLLIGQSDTAAISKLCARIQQLFPDKPDFMLEVLTEQIHQGNAATAIDSIQNLLRSNPKNKQAWDLVVQAYQQLNQPQRVKMAYQHYLNFFPDEPAAMLGLISSVTAEHNLAHALELLDTYESDLISAGFLQQLEQIYHSLDKIDPISIRVLEGLIRIATAAGNENEIHSLTSKLNSLCSVSGEIQSDSPLPESTLTSVNEQSLSPFESNELPFFGESPSEETLNLDVEAPESESFPEKSPNPEPPETTFDETQFPEEEIEIDLELDLDATFGSQDQEVDEASGQGNWLDSVNNLFDSIDIIPRGVKFGDDMESSDAQSHYDLGQAFKEMGLFDEAINEFRQASQDHPRRVECLIMQCACLRERGEPEKAISILLTLLHPELSEEESCVVKYELASGYEAVGKTEESNTLLNEIYATNPDFRDIRLRLNATIASEPLDFSDDDLKDF